MNNLIDKYRKDELTPEELSELRTRISFMKDGDIEEHIYTAWLNDDIDTSSVDDARMDRIKNGIQTKIGKKRSGLSLLIQWGQIAAAVLLPVFVIMTIYFYRENSLIISDEMVITTGRAERATITLPDGSTVSLNSESRLVYLPKDYNWKERKISFSGEGYFKVHHNENIPFLINARGLEVKVLGTTFNLQVRQDDTTAELSLEEGSVYLLSTLSNKNVVLKENQKAILEHSTGNITVVTEENIYDISAWRKGDMVFHNTELSQIIRSIEENYDVTIKVECKDCLTDPFKGTMPVNDLNEVLEIIEAAYHLKAVINGKEIVLK